MWDLAPDVACRTVVPRFNRYWDSSTALLAQHQENKVNGTSQINGNDTVAFNAEGAEVKVLDGSKANEEKKKDDAEILISLLPSLIKAFGFSFFVGSMLKLCHDLLVFIAPLLLQRIIRFSASDEPLWRGILYAAMMLVVQTIQTVLLSQYFYRMYLIGVWVRSALISALYRKGLRVSQSAKKDTTTGEVVNLMSVDVQRIVDMMVRLIFYFNVKYNFSIHVCKYM